MITKSILFKNHVNVIECGDMIEVHTVSDGQVTIYEYDRDFIYQQSASDKITDIAQAAVEFMEYEAHGLR